MQSADIKHRFAGRRVLITGGTRGIAGQIAQELVDQGASVCLSHSETHDAAAGFAGSAARFAQVLRGRAAPEAQVETVDQDMSLPEAGAHLAAQAATRFGTIDSLVLSASVQIEKPLPQQTTADLELQYRVNLTSNIEVINAVLPVMVKASFGRVLAISSVQDTAPVPAMPVYAMTKAAMVNLFSSLARSHAQDGITFNTLSPGLIATDRNQHKQHDTELWSSMEAGANPMARAGTPEEVSPSALHLLSQQASFITGAHLAITGGAHLAGFRPGEAVTT